MLKRWLKYLPAGLLLAAVVLVLAWLMRPRSFAEFAPAEHVAEVYLYTTSVHVDGHELYEAWPDREEVEPLLNLLEPGMLRFKSRSRQIEWEPEETLFHLAFVCEQEDGRTEVVGIDLCTDGMVYIHHSWLGFIGYRLSCDMDAIESELMRLLGIA